jgi:hypothetical protein
MTVVYTITLVDDTVLGPLVRIIITSSAAAVRHFRRAIRIKIMQQNWARLTKDRIEVASQIIFIWSNKRQNGKQQM